MNAGTNYAMWKIVLLALFEALFIAWLYRQVKKQEPIETPDFEPFKLTRNSVRYERQDLKDEDDTEWDDIPRPAA